MKHLLQLLLIVMVAVVLTVFAQGNDGRVLLSVSTKRIELSLNLAIVLLFVGFFLLHYSLLALRFSVQLSSRFKYFFSNRKQKALLQANTNALIAWITEDNQESHRALQQAIASGAETDLSYFIRAAFCLQYHLLDEAEQILSERSVVQEEPYVFAAQVLWIKVHLEKKNYAKAWSVLQNMDMHMNALPLIRKLRVLTLVGLQQWTEALGLVEGVLTAYPDDMHLVECAAQVFGQERLYGKSIVQFERMYAHRPTADVAVQLSEQHRLAGQADLAEQWKNKVAIESPTR